MLWKDPEEHLWGGKEDLLEEEASKLGREVEEKEAKQKKEGEDREENFRKRGPHDEGKN